MHKYEELEKLYYKRKYTKYFIFLVIIVSFVSFLFFIKTQFNEKKVVKNDTIKEKSKIEKKTAQVEKIEKKIIQKKEVIKNPKPNIEQKIVKQEKEHKIKKLVLYPIFPDIEDTDKEVKQIKVEEIKKETKKTAIKIETKPLQTNNINSGLKIVVKSAKTTNDLIYMYKKSPTYENAIKIANVYFDKEEYSKSIQWAKKANKIKPEDYESWYIFAKSLIKLEKKEKAKQVLIAYLNTYGPDKHIEELLRSIK